jgi:predicted lipoprotein with Yx(FWY)xxD motif
MNVLGGIAMRSIRALVVASLALSVCGGATNSSGAAPAGVVSYAPAATAAAASAVPAPAAPSAAYAGGGMGDDYGGYGGGYGGYSGGAPAASAPPIVVSANLQILDNAKYGKILAASNGMTLYTFKLDSPNTSTCNDQCARDWPPLVLASGTPIAPAGMKGTLGLMTRMDGSRQVTYNGSPLYFYGGDQKVNDVSGEGSGDVWFSVKGP